MFTLDVLDTSQIESGFGLNKSQVDIMEKNLGVDWVRDSISFSKDAHWNTEEGINLRLNMVAFALTIPKEMIP